MAVEQGQRTKGWKDLEEGEEKRLVEGGEKRKAVEVERGGKGGWT